VKPAPLARLSITADEVFKGEPEHEKFCRDLVEKMGGIHNEGPYTPYSSKADQTTAASRRIPRRTMCSSIHGMSRVSAGWTNRRTATRLRIGARPASGAGNILLAILGTPRISFSASSRRGRI
jgi:hypothetical protein